MKQINFRELNSRNYTNSSSNNSPRPQYKKKKAIKNLQKKETNICNSKINYMKGTIKEICDENEKIIVSLHHKNKHQTYQEAYNELNSYINKVRNYTFSYIDEKKRAKGFFGRIISKIRRIDEEELEKWIDEISDSPQIEYWMDKIDNLVDFVDDFYNKDLTDYVESRLGNLFPNFY